MSEDPRCGLPSASNLWRTASCPGWLALSRGAKRVETKDSLTGTLGHAALAGEDVELDSRIEITVEACREIEARIVKEFNFPEQTPVREERLWYRDVSGQKLFSGQLDVGYIDLERNSGLIIDFKTLYGSHQKASENWQLRVLDLLWSKSRMVDINYVVLVQPMVSGQYSIAEYGAEERAQSEIEIVAAVKAALAPNAPRTPGEWCKFCPAKTICPEVNEKTKMVVVTASGASLELMTPKERGELLDLIVWGEDKLAAKKAVLRSLLEADSSAVEGWSLKSGKNRRTISNTNAAFESLKEFFTEQEFLALCEITPAKLESFVYDFLKDSQIGKPTRDKAKEIVAKSLGDLVETKQNKASLAKT
jgi:hypothetical protein